MTTRGARLRSYILARTGGTTGWQTRLVAATGVKRQTISKYTKPTFDGYPELGTLAALAAGLKVQTFEIVAAMDGEEAVSLSDPRLSAAIEQAVEAAVSERLGPRQESPGPSGTT